MDNEQQYNAWQEHLAGTEAAVPEPHHPWHVTVARLLPDLQDQRVLEVGCGRGDFAIWLANNYPRAEVLAVDFSEVAIATAQGRAAACVVGSQVDDSARVRCADRRVDD